MTTPIAEALGPIEHFAERAEHALEGAWQRITHNDHNNPKEPTVSVVDELKTAIASVESHASKLYQSAEDALKKHLPGIEATITTIENEPFVQAYLGARLAVPEHLVSLAMDFLNKLVQANASTPASSSPAASSSAPAEQVPAQ